MFHIKNLALTNFRCYEQYFVEFAPNINIIYGDNAVGKTSLVEAVHCLGLCKSHKSVNDIDLIKKKESFARIKAQILNNTINDDVLISYMDKKKKIQKNQKVINQLSDYIGYFNIVIFSPEDMDLIKGTPLERRKFLDINISQIKPTYLESLIKYRKLLKQRNEILKNYAENHKFDYTLLEVVTENLIKEAKVIVKDRATFIEDISPFFNSINQKISDKGEIGTIKYLPNTNWLYLEKEYFDRIKTDILLKTTTVGPHRDDFLISINNENASVFASQGQQRTLSLSIKLALAEIIKIKSKNLVIILDDVFSELDINRQNQILKLLDRSNQIFITTTTIENLSTDILNQSKMIKILKEKVEDE